MASELFNQKTIDRLCSNITVSAKQKKAARDWLNLLESDLLREEKKNYPKFMELILKDLLGYDIVNLAHEEGNIEFPFKNSKGKNVVGFEAKGTNTKDLFALQAGRKKEHEKPIKQIWDYMGGKLNLQYGVVTNYKDFVLLDREKGYSKVHKFDFTSIKGNENKLKEFIAVFSKESIIDKGFLEELYKKSVVEEKEFTKEFYKLFHETRLMLIKEFQDNGASKEESIHFAQLSLNRLMFVFFAEDTGKLERRLFERTLLKMLETKDILSDGTNFISGMIINLFQKLDSGSDSPIKIFGFNGGLFREQIPRTVYFKDLQKKGYFKKQMQYSQLKKHPKLNEAEQELVKTYKDKLNPIISNLLIMGSYDFSNEVNVNILGHIFEQSLSDLEELNEGQTSRRKKEGVYYTPEYITDYICKNTIIPYLSNKDNNTVDDLIEEYHNNISELEKKFKEIKILDPACGSGAFLIKAVEILLEIQKGIQEVKQSQGDYTTSAGKGKKKVDGVISLVKWTEEDEARDIIENNIYGVDINEESVEITKLSLFLKIARKNKKLIDLSKNIKCGNSLIDDPAVDPKAFNWQKEFKEIFDKGGFNVVIGNPPYVRVQSLAYAHIDYFKEKYLVAYKRIDIALIFFELGARLLKIDGKLGFISSIQFINAEYGRHLRELLLTKKINIFIDFNGQPVFGDATTYPGIIIFSNSAPAEFPYFGILKLNEQTVNQLSTLRHLRKSTTLITMARLTPSNLDSNIWVLKGKEDTNLLEKIKSTNQTMGKIANPCTGLTTGADKVLILSEKQTQELNLEKDILLPVVRGKNISRWAINEPFDYVIYPYILQNSQTILIKEATLKSKFPIAFAYLKENKKKLLDRMDSRKTVADSKSWYGLIRKGKLDLFKSKKILTPGVSKHNRFALDIDGKTYLCGGAGVFGLVPDELNSYLLLGILNSKVVEYFLHLISTKKQGGYYSYLNSFLEQIPLPDKTDDNIAKKVRGIIKLTAEKTSSISKGHTLIKSEFGLNKLPKKFDKFEEMELTVFLNEIDIFSNSKLSLIQKQEWIEYFDKHKKELAEINETISRQSDEIDELVYGLYNITEKEKKIIEESLK